MTYPPGGQPPYGQPQVPGQPGYPQQPGQPYGYPPQGGHGYPPPGYTSQGNPQPPEKKRTGLIIGLVVLVLVVAGAITAGVVLTVQGRTPLASDEKKIEVAIRDFYDTLSNDGFAAASAVACAADKADFEAMNQEGKSTYDSADISVTINKVDNVVINGDRATAHIDGKFTMSVAGEDAQTDNSTEERLKKEDGTWKVCASVSDEN
ncbi:Rv0361 family membrane protein [Nocardia australiensis]|uniref:Rv0361 family membrane protein n=1 Tax=Nocardia australiensis TaxID=2887191 RepID=UPI001D14C606|nr:hypothetical protein [Nocardia australiensis]